MSSGLTTPPPIPMPTPVVVSSSSNDVEGFIDQRLRHTRRQLKTTDVAGGLVTLAVGVLAYLFAAAMIDHWLVAGGLGVWSRTLLWLGLVVAVVAYFVLRVLPPLLHRVNPIFAAATIEKSRPTLKNSLINFLLLRNHRREVAAPVYRALESRAAADLSDVRIETAVDRAYLIRTGSALAAIVALFAIYLILSPKNPLRSAARILLPWSAIEAPTRVTIRDVRPGDATEFLGESVAVSAEVAGLAEGEPLNLVYSSADGQIVDQTIPMTLPQGEYRHQCRFPPGKLGLQQDYEYYLAAGDCRTARHRITVQIAPAIVVERVDYRYPGYTGLAPQSVERQGDLRAIEGTEVTLYAKSNTDIKPTSAEIDLGCTGRQGVRMDVDGRAATGRFTLRMSADDPQRPKYDSYLLRIADLQGRENLQPIRHRIDVIRDLPPEVFVVDQPVKDVQVPENGSLPIKVRAEDPDFGLRRVALRAERAGRGLSITPLLERRRPAPPLAGEFAGTAAFEPARLGLKAGDRVQYWAEAEDNREPVPNRTATDRRWIVVVAPDAQQKPDEKQGKSDNAENNAKSDGSNGGKGEKGAKGDSGNSQDQGKQNDASEKGQDQGQQSGNAADKPNDRVNPDSDPGSAMDEILKDREKEQKKQEQQQGESQKGEGQKGEGQQGESQQGEGQKGKDQKAEGQKGEGQKGEGQQGESQQGEGQKGKDQKAEGQKGEGQKGEGQQGEGQSGGNAEGQAPGATDGKPTQEATPGSPNEKGGDNEKSDSGESPSKSSKQRPSDTPGETSGDRSGNGDVGEGQKSPNEGGGSPGSHTPAESGGKLDRGAGGDEVGPKPSEKGAPGKSTEGGKGEKGEKSAKGEKGGQGEKGEGATDKADLNAKSDSRNAGKKDANPNEKTGAAGDEGQSPDGKGTTDENKKGGKSGKPDDNTAKQDGKTDVAGATGGKPSDDKNAPKGFGGNEKDADGKPVEDADTNNQPATPGDLKGKGKPSDVKVDPQQKPTGQGNSGEPGKPLENAPTGGTPGGAAEGPKSPDASSATGGGPNPKATDAKPPEPADGTADEANAEYARRQTELALEHLRDVMAREKPELLDRLGWTKDDARRFLDRWESMKQAASEKSERGQAARKQLDDAIRSLGLRPRGVELGGGDVVPDAARKLRDPARFAPPPDWAEQFRAYTRGVGGADRQADSERN